MASRKTKFANGEYYHVYNRGTDKRDVFLDDADYLRFLLCLREFNCIEPIGSLYEKSLRDKNANGGSTSTVEIEPQKALVEIVCYCLNSNHYHFILKQVAENGISKFIQKVGTGYTMFFNKKNERSGSLFQGRFKSIYIDSNEYLLYLSVYVNGNHFIHAYDKVLEVEPPIGGSTSEFSVDGWKYSSLPDYAEKRNGTLCNKSIILEQFSNAKDYLDFVGKHSLEMKKKKEFAKYLLEEK